MRVPALALSLLVLSAACKREIVPEPYAPTGAHDAYGHALELAGLHRTALGREWAKAAEGALRSPVAVRSPYEETFYVDPEEAFALGYRFSVKRGQRTEVKLEIDPPADWRVFLDLFRSPEGDEGIEQVASGGEGDMRLAFEPRKDGEYLLRIQSELLRGGNCTVVIRNVPSLEFPVAGRDTAAIRSSFGAPRDGGRRSHHGVDIFAPRGTEVLAPSRARVRRVDDWNLGGRVIWLEDPERDLRLYFAHLETQDVVEGTWVAPGDRIGTVGNSGNARTTPPHLHFGIYVRGEGPINPHAFLHHPEETSPPMRADRAVLGGWVKTRKTVVPLSFEPFRSDETPFVEIPGGTRLRVWGATGSSFHVELPSGMTGFVTHSETEPIIAEGGE